MAEGLRNATELVRVALVIALVCAAVQLLTRKFSVPRWLAAEQRSPLPDTSLQPHLAPALVHLSDVRCADGGGAAACDAGKGPTPIKHQLASSWHRRFARWQAARSLSALGTQPACAIACA